MTILFIFVTHWIYHVFKGSEENVAIIYGTHASSEASG